MKSIKISLLDKDGNTQYGLNWGQRDNRDPNQAYLQLSPDVYRSEFFPKKGKYFIVETDDGETMIMCRAQKDLGTALQTPDNNAFLGEYIRKRLGVTSGKEITKEDIIRSGISEITFLKIDNMHYILNFEDMHDIPDFNKNFILPRQVIYYGAPGTGKSFAIDDLTTQENSVRTTFHPDSDYASFVGAYKPTMEATEIHYVNSDGIVRYTNPDKNKEGKLHPGTEKKIVYKYVPQAFLKAYVEAWKIYAEGRSFDAPVDMPYYLIIEEINRGNCAQIFGDLFQLLDRNNNGSSSYPISADEDIAQFLKNDERGFNQFSDRQKEIIRNFKLIKDNNKTEEIGEDILNGRLLLLPPNLQILATMNTSDQSLFPIDSAFKRRWDWIYMPIRYDAANWKFKVDGNLYSWGEFLKVINPEIYSLTESSDKQMGYFFVKADPDSGIISEDVFKNKVLFYLWTEVFKDFDISSEVFKNKKANRSFRFTDFFEDNEAIGNFIENLGLEIIETEEDDEPDSTDGRDYSIYSINGKGSFNKRKTVINSLLKYIEQNPEFSAEQIITNWETVNPGSNYFIKTEEEYNEIISNYPAQASRYHEVNTGTNEKLYITNQWGADSFDTFVNLMNQSSLGIEIEKVSDSENKEEDKEDSETKAWYTKFLTEVRNLYPQDKFNFQSVHNNYLGMSKGLPSKVGFINKVKKREGVCCVQFWIQPERAEEIFNKLQKHKSEIESQLSFPLTWLRSLESEGGNKHAEITAISEKFDFENPDDYREATRWMADNGIKLYYSFKPYLDELK